MRKLFFLMASVVAIHAFGQSNSNGYSISGTTEGIKDTIKQVYLVYRFNDVTVRDSSAVKNGTFSLAGTVTEPVKVTLYVRYASANPALQGIEQDRDVLSVFVQPKQKVIIDCANDSFAHASVKGGALNAELKKITAGEMKFNMQWRHCTRAIVPPAKIKTRLWQTALKNKLTLLTAQSMRKCMVRI